MVYDPFIHSAKTAVEKAPDGYDKGESAAYLASFEDSYIPEDKKVNIIAIMLEAYNDFSKFGTLEFGTDPYEYFHSLQSESLHGELVPNIFAGGTIDTASIGSITAAMWPNISASTTTGSAKTAMPWRATP